MAVGFENAPRWHRGAFEAREAGVRMDEDSATPYGGAALAYWRAGWRGILPLPHNAKGPVPRGFTGWAGSDPSWPDIAAWIEGGVILGRTSYPASNIALRLPRGVYGLDVDDYEGKTGGAALGRLVEAYGPLPPTWIVSSRDDSMSGIRLFRADHGPDRRWRDEPGGHQAGIEAIHFGHRYVVTWPSIHPDTGNKYTLRRPDGVVAADGEIPRPDELPAMPPRFVYELSEPGEVRTGDMAGHGETVNVVAGWQLGDPCRRVTEAHQRGMTALMRAGDGAALHPAGRDAIHELCNLGNEGHRGVRRALGEHHDQFVEIRCARGVEARGAAIAEWWRLVRGAVGKLPAGQRREVCDCDAWSSEGLNFAPDDWPASPAGTEALSSTPGTSGGTAVDLFDDPAPIGAPNPQLEFLLPEQQLTEQIQGEPTPAAAKLAGGPHLDEAVNRVLAEMVTASEMGRRPPPVPIVAGLLFRNTLAWLIGKSGSMKSFVALDVAAHVAASKAWGTRKVWGGVVVYLVAEGGPGMPLRVRAWEDQNGPIDPNLIMLPRAVQIAGAGWPSFVTACAYLGPVLVVVDTQARVTVGVQENDNAEMGAMIDKLDKLRAATGACVLVVHHIGRSGDDARGASAIDGAQDTELKLTRKGGPDALRAVLTMDKQKDAADSGEIDIKATVVDLGFDQLTGEPLSSLVTTPDLFGDPFPEAPWRAASVGNQALILAVLRELFSESGGTKAEVRAAVRERGLRDQAWLNNMFGKAWNQLLQKEAIERLGTTQRFVAVDDNE